MNWTHKGFDITIRGDRFAVNIEGKSVTSSSLSGAKKAIDKHLDYAAKKEVLNIPVVYIAYRSQFSKDTDSVERNRIVGFNPEDNSVLWESNGNVRIRYVLPDSPENEALLQQWIDIQDQQCTTQKLVDARHIRTSITSFGSKKIAYADALTSFKSGLASAIDASNPEIQ